MTQVMARQQAIACTKVDFLSVAFTREKITKDAQDTVLYS